MSCMPKGSFRRYRFRKPDDRATEITAASTMPDNPDIAAKFAPNEAPK